MNIIAIHNNSKLSTILLKKLKNSINNTSIKEINNLIDVRFKMFYKTKNIILFFSPTKEELKLFPKLQKHCPQSIFIVLSPEKSNDFILSCLKSGAHDYIQVPLPSAILEEKLIRWNSFLNKQTIQQSIQYGEIQYSPHRKEFYLKKQPLLLSKSNKKLLLLFLQSPESMLSSQYIQEKIWGDLYTCEKSRNIRSNIQLLRKALPQKYAQWIQTIRGEGYMLRKI